MTSTAKSAVEADPFFECHNWKPGMAFKYIGDDETMKHEVHYFVGHTPIGPFSQVWIAEIPGRQRLHWNGFPNQYERWPEHDRIKPEMQSGGVGADAIEALKPFAELCKQPDTYKHEDDSTNLYRIRASDLRRARDVVATHQNKERGE